jgi:hypothetical protein
MVVSVINRTIFPDSTVGSSPVDPISKLRDDSYIGNPRRNPMSLDKSLSLVSATQPALADGILADRSRMTSRILTQIELLEKVKAEGAVTRE